MARNLPALLDAESFDSDDLGEALAQMVMIGGAPKRLAEYFFARMGPIPSTRTQRMGAAIRALAAHCSPGTIRAVARAVTGKVARYAATRWLRERAMLSAPLVGGEEGRLLHAVMMNSCKGGAPGFETIRAALAVVKNRSIALNQIDDQFENHNEEAA
jgi:hypothetical protein